MNNITKNIILISLFLFFIVSCSSKTDNYTKDVILKKNEKLTEEVSVMRPSSNADNVDNVDNVDNATQLDTKVKGQIGNKLSPFEAMIAAPNPNENNSQKNETHDEVVPSLPQSSEINKQSHNTASNVLLNKDKKVKLDTATPEENIQNENSTKSINQQNTNKLSKEAKQHTKKWNIQRINKKKSDRNN